MVLAPEKKAVVKKPHEPRAAHDDNTHNDTAPAEPQQAPAEPVSDEVVETADPA
jgi:hypothetical protein